MRAVVGDEAFTFDNNTDSMVQPIASAQQSNVMVCLFSTLHLSILKKKEFLFFPKDFEKHIFIQSS